jgi:hypothetical protein
MAQNDPRYLTDEQLQEAASQNVSVATSPPEEQNLERELPLANYDDIPDFSEELLFSWVAPERIFRPRLGKKYLRNLILLLVLIVLLLVFTNQFALLIVVLAFIFLAYVLANVPPQKTRHDITNYGIYTNNKFYSWLARGKRFWWEQSQGQKYVVIETQFFPYRLVLLAGSVDNEAILEEVLSHYLILQKPEITKTDKLIDWVRRTFPLG